MSKLIQFGAEARRTIFAGVDLLYRAVSATLGPKGRNVVIKRPFKPPHLTKDGVTVAKEIDNKDPLQNIGIEMIREVASKTGDIAGDGTTTATVLAHNMIANCIDFVDNEKANPIWVKRGMEAALKDVETRLEAMAIPVNDNIEVLKNIATISANNDELLGEIISSAYSDVGMYGLVQMSKGERNETYTEMINGIEFERGFLSPYFANDSENIIADYEDVVILFYDGVIKDAQEILPIVEQAVNKRLPLLIVADEIKDGALKMLVINRFKQNIPVIAVKAPSFGDKRKDLMYDMAVLTGGKYVSDLTGLTLDNITLNDLGQADRIIVSDVSTKIIGGRGEQSEIEDRYNRVKKTVESIENPAARKTYEKRLATLSLKGAAIIKVGAATETELFEKMDRVEDAIYATKAALEGGVIPGGGAALAWLEKNTSKFTHENNDFVIGYEIVINALNQPMLKIIKNSGQNIDLSSLYEFLKDANTGYNALTNEWVNMVEAGILDPYKVTRTALRNAVSIAASVLTTEVIISPDPDDLPREITPEINPMNFI